jgi:hypothetical protein
LRIRIKEGKCDPQKKKKIKKFPVSGVGCSLLKAEGFFCNLDVLYGGLGIGVFFDAKKCFFFSCNFLHPDLIRIRIRIGI